MTDNEKTKALQCCIEGDCDNCPYDEQTACNEYMKQDCLDLINRLQADRDNYKQIAENQQKIILDKAFENKRLKEKVESQQAENERLETENKRYAELEQGCYVTGYKNIKAEAYKEFAERLKERKYLDDGWSHGEHPYVVEESDIDEVLEELVGEDND